MQIVNLKDYPQFIPTLAQWHHQQWQALNPGRTLENRIAFMQHFLSEEFLPSTFVAVDKQLLGSASIIKNDMDTRSDLSPWLASVFVAEEFRRQGIGGSLVQFVMQQAKIAQIPRIYLFTPDQQGFYQKLGWRLLTEEIYRDHPVSVMAFDTTTL